MLEHSIPCRVFFWIATYDDGQAIPQFHPDTLKETLWEDLDHNRIVKFILLPFSISFAEELLKKGIPVYPKLLPRYELQLQKDQRLIYFARPHQQLRIFYRCRCGWEWQWGEIHQDLANNDPKPYVSPICPKCKAFQIYVCPDCHDSLSKRHYCKECNTTLEGDVEKLECPKCEKWSPELREIEYFCIRCNKKIYNKSSDIPTQVLRDLNTKYMYMLGSQQTINGKNIKNILFIDENGSVIVSDDFNKVYGSERNS